MRILLRLCNMASVSRGARPGRVASRAAARRGRVGTWDPAPGSTPRPEAAARVRSCGSDGEGSISSEFGRVAAAAMDGVEGGKGRTGLTDSISD
jgi:hypothetical protein